MAKKFKSIREESKTDWGITLEEDEPLTNDQLRTGALLRIADASEKMAIRHTELINEVESQKRTIQYLRSSWDSAIRTASALRGQITRLKKKIAQP